MVNGADQQEIDLLLQKEWREKIIPGLGTESWVTVYQSPFDQEVRRAGLFCGLVPNSSVQEVLRTYEWDIHIGDFAPSFMRFCAEKTEDSNLIYDRFGHHDLGIEPLIIVRNFQGLKPASIEVIEEFRLFHNLYFESSHPKFVKFDERGDEVSVVKLSDNFVDIRRKHLRQFLAAKDMSLAIYFENIYHSHLEFEKLNVAQGNCVTKAENEVYEFFIGKWEGNSDYQSFSAVLGKKIIGGLPLEKCGLWPFEEMDQQRHEEFIIGIDENDEPITCSPEGISHTTSKEVQDSTGKSHKVTYITPVFFKRSVLDKYYREPTKYRIEDGQVSCGGLWLLRMDNNHEDYVIVLLGRLRDDLPVSEQSHWKHHNKPPDGNLSKTASLRYFQAKWAEPEDSALRFKLSYEAMSQRWHQTFEWHLFMPLRSKDRHHFNSVRRPLTDEPTELNEIVLSLSILLQDSINNKELGKRIPDFESKNSDGSNKQNIPILREYLESEAFPDAAKYVEYLRMLQMLRSNSGTVHRRNEKEYQKAVRFFSLDSKSTVQVADDIFTVLTEFLDSLREHFCTDAAD